jgi:hypothetical protein
MVLKPVPNFKNLSSFFVMNYNFPLIDRQTDRRTSFVMANIITNFHEICEGKAIPLQTWTGPEDSRSLRLPDSKTVGT